MTLPDEPAWIEGDPTRLEQVFGNLLNNAAKYTPTGGRITLAVDRQREEVSVRVRDTGVGLSAEMLPRVFELFSQADLSLDGGSEFHYAMPPMSVTTLVLRP